MKEYGYEHFKGSHWIFRMMSIAYPTAFSAPYTMDSAFSRNGLWLLKRFCRFPCYSTRTCKTAKYVFLCSYVFFCFSLRLFFRVEANFTTEYLSAFARTHKLTFIPPNVHIHLDFVWHQPLKKYDILSPSRRSIYEMHHKHYVRNTGHNTNRIHSQIATMSTKPLATSTTQQH